MEVNKIYNLVGLKKILDNSIDLILIDPLYYICTIGQDVFNKLQKKIKLTEIKKKILFLMLFH